MHGVVVGFLHSSGLRKACRLWSFLHFLLDTGGRMNSSRQHEHGDSTRLFRDERYRAMKALFDSISQALYVIYVYV
jgi:hypothetical protein